MFGLSSIALIESRDICLPSLARVHLRCVSLLLMILQLREFFEAIQYSLQLRLYTNKSSKILLYTHLLHVVH